MFYLRYPLNDSIMYNDDVKIGLKLVVYNIGYILADPWISP